MGSSFVESEVRYIFFMNEGPEERIGWFLVCKPIFMALVWTKWME